MYANVAAMILHDATRRTRFRAFDLKYNLAYSF